MTLQDQIVDAVHTLPEDKLPEPFHFIKILQGTYVKPLRQEGILKGQVWMSDDFNEPLDF